MGKNKMLDFIDEIERLTNGQCRVGPGPYGFGVENKHTSKIGLIITTIPDMVDIVNNSVTMPADIDNYEISVAGIDMTSYKELANDEIELAALNSGDPATQMMANVIKELSKHSKQISSEDYNQAFDKLVDRVLMEMDAEDNREETSQGHSATEKPSVLARIREAAQAPREPRGDKPARDKTGPEL